MKGRSNLANRKYTRSGAGAEDAGQPEDRDAARFPFPRPGCVSMQLTGIPFGVTDWSTLPPTEHRGEVGTAHWRTCHFGTVRVRMVDYSPGYRADHWCEKGHILLCLAGALETELADGRRFTLRPGMSYQVADHAEAHRSSSPTGATLFIVD